MCSNKMMQLEASSVKIEFISTSKYISESKIEFALPERVLRLPIL